MTFYLKYRPKNLDELDLPEVGESLKKIVDSGKIPHAFLFAGPKGTGKTSAARILAKIINCENLGKNGMPCDRCDECKSITKGTNLDVIELDAASHRGIDDIRTLRDAVKLAPTAAKKKIYIIDEAHMLTTEASNALLKTLEEPPEHVVFILATTNPEKLIDTIRSRTTLIQFRKATPEEVVKSLKRVVTAEKIKISEESLQRIAGLSGGAFRDAIKILEQFSSEGEEYLDKYKNSELGNFISFLVKKDGKSAITEIEKNVSTGSSVELFLSELLETFHQAILAEMGLGENKLDGLSRDDLIQLSELFTEANRSLADSPIEQLPVEIAVIEWCDGQVKDEKWSHSMIKVKSENTPLVKKVETAPAQDLKESTQESVGMINPHTNDLVMGVNDDIWKKILSEVHPVNASIEGLLRASRPVGYDGSTLTLGVFYKFHKERLEDSNHRKILESVLEKVLNSPTRVICTLVEPPPKKIIEEAKTEPVLTEGKDNDIIKAAEEIFGN
jgi:DNA polymerase-3 subunit gamma/tau